MVNEYLNKDFSTQQWMLNFAIYKTLGVLNEQDTLFEIDEAFASNISVQIITNNAQYFITKFLVNSIAYIFEAKISISIKNMVNVSFYPEAKTFDIVGSKKYLGDLGSGIFKSMHLLFEKQPNITGFSFAVIHKINKDNQEIDNPLFKLYSSDYVQKLLQLRFNLEQKSKKTYGSTTVWTYVRAI